MISILNLTKKYGQVTAVDNISFDVKQGEILGFLGPNGAGKTTTMKILTGYLQPTSGKTLIKDVDCSLEPMTTKKLIGYVPESFPLYEDMMVYDYLQYIAEIRDIPSSERETKIKEVSSLCGLNEVVAKDISQLSRGYRQRVGLAQAMIHDPDILILDEPTSGLDPNQIVEIRNLIKRVGQKKTVILSTHILPEVTATCDRVLIINKGKLVADGTPDELLARNQSNNVITVQFDKAYEGIEENLKRIDFVESVKQKNPENPDKPTFEIESNKIHDIRAKIFQFAVDKGWVLIELKMETVSLEDVFRDLTIQ